ncbi:unnamed protein product [Calypogeia fissa]
MPTSCVGGVEVEEGGGGGSGGSDDENGMSNCSRRETPSSSASSSSDPEQWSRMSGGTKGWRLRGVEWRVKLGILPGGDASVDRMRRATADGRRKYADLRRRLLVDPHIMDEDYTASQLRMDNPLSQDPESVWGRYFRNAELEKTIDIDLTRLYPEQGMFFQSAPCQAMMRRILLVWSLIHPQFSYRQGMHELLAPLLYVLHVDVVRLSQVKHRFEDLFDDRFDSLSLQEQHVRDKVESAKSFCGEMIVAGDSINFKEGAKAIVESVVEERRVDLSEIIQGSDMYGVEGELGALLSARFLEHDAYCMLDALLDGQGGAVAMAEYFQGSSGGGKPRVIEASAAVYRTLAAADITLYSHLVEIEVEPQFFALRWLRLLFGREFVLEDLLRIWDAIFEADNTPLYQHGGDDDSIMKISQRGALISSFSVSMLLYVRPALLAAPDVTACLQRLLNFPQVPDVRDLIEGAKTLQPLAQAAAKSPGNPVLHNIRTSDTRASGGKHLRNGSVSPPTSQRLALRLQNPSPSSPEILRLSMSLPGSYWEEKWTHSVLQKKTPDELFRPEAVSRDFDHVERDGSNSARTFSRSTSEGRNQRPDQVGARGSRNHDSSQESSDDEGQEMLRRGGESSSHHAAGAPSIRHGSVMGKSPRPTALETRGHFRRYSGHDVPVAATSPIATQDKNGHVRRNSLQDLTLASASTSAQERGRSLVSESPRKSSTADSEHRGPVSAEALESAMFGDDDASESLEVVDKFEVTRSTTASDLGDEKDLTLQDNNPVQAEIESPRTSVEPSDDEAVEASEDSAGSSSSEAQDISDVGVGSMNEENEATPSVSLGGTENSEDSPALKENNALQSELPTDVSPSVDTPVTEGNEALEEKQISQDKEGNTDAPLSETQADSQRIESKGDHAVEEGISKTADILLPSKSKPPLPPSRLGRFSWVWSLGRNSFAEKTVTTKVSKEDSPGNEVTPNVSDTSSDLEVSNSAAAAAAQRRKKSWWRANSDVVPEESVATTSTDLGNEPNNTASDVVESVDLVKPAIDSPAVASGEQLKDGLEEEIPGPTKDTGNQPDDINPSEEAGAGAPGQEPVIQPEDTTPCPSPLQPCQSGSDQPKDVLLSATLQAEEGQDAAKDPKDLTPSVALQALGQDAAKKSRDMTPSAALQALGQAVLDHVQVLESALTQTVTGLGIESVMWTPAVRERIETTNKPGLGNKGQGAALAAIAELRKISQALQQM